MPGNRGRGRGAGGRGGRGRGGRGRGGQGQGRGAANSVNQDGFKWKMEESDKENVDNTDINFEENIREYFTGAISIDQHYEAQKNYRSLYLAALEILEKFNVQLSQNAKVRALAAAWLRGDDGITEKFLLSENRCGLVEVIKAISILDANREIRAIKKKLKRLDMQKSKVKPKKMGRLKSKIENLEGIKTSKGSATSSVCNKVKRWVRTLSAEKLEFYALHFPSQPWRQLADICHLNPNDFSSLPWFLPFCFGKPAPDDTLPWVCANLCAENANDLLKEFVIPYSHIRRVKDVNLTNASKGRIAKHESLDQVLWYYEELTCPEADAFIKTRIENGEEINLNIGKLLDRLLAIKMIREDVSMTNCEYEWCEETETLSKRKRVPNKNKATFFPLLSSIVQEKMNGISLPLQSPILVAGDKSGSMDIAIRTSTIIASILAAMSSAKFVLFDNKAHEVENVPTDIKSALDLAISVEADFSTSPAAALYPFYQRNEIVKTIILITDEDENTKFKGFNFIDLYKKYAKKVFPARLVFVSFLPQHAEGKMVSALKKEKISVLQFVFNDTRPDLSKLDNLFGLLSLEGANFEDMLKKRQEELSKDI
ncbi:unnamed protein product [Dimorphilus gyrociliatus]|uniref:Uncharacterized protein n=1 Tax=Dimorphilus gyrociliatus TaxID=2664684 RepID=A0A7I8VPQ7_9ANNE|nr:unnamed protein product [Dimorphilus gyrociliatus]